MKDNTALFKKRKEELGANAPVCRVCGDRKVHTESYDKPTMDCIQSMRVERIKLENALEALRKLVTGK